MKVGDVVKWFKSTTFLRVVIGVDPLRLYYLDTQRECEADSSDGAYTFFRPATASELAAAGLPPAPAKLEPEWVRVTANKRFGDLIAENLTMGKPYKVSIWSGEGIPCVLADNGVYVYLVESVWEPCPSPEQGAQNVAQAELHAAQGRIKELNAEVAALTQEKAVARNDHRIAGDANQRLILERDGARNRADLAESTLAAVRRGPAVGDTLEINGRKWAWMEVLASQPALTAEERKFLHEVAQATIIDLPPGRLPGAVRAAQALRDSVKGGA